MADPALRLARLLAALPRLYTADVQGSAVGTLLQSMAAALTRCDDDTSRVLHDRWINLASGYRAVPDEPSALERLGQLVGVPRLMPTGAAAESVEAYRQRIRVTATALSRGLATPRALLSLAIADLGFEACPRMEEVGSPSARAEQLWAAEATVAWGVPAAVRRRCPVCAGGADGPCPNRASRAIDAWVSENPVQAAVHRETGITPWQDFPVPNSSLVADRPEVSVHVTHGRLEFPALQNRATGEILLFADTLRTGETLLIVPGLTPDETLPFENHDATPVHPWLFASPRGQARVIGQGTARDVSREVFFLYGSRFNAPASAFDATCFCDILQAVRTPAIRNGRDSWRLLSMPNPAAEFDADTSRFAGADEAGTRFAKWDSEITDLGVAAQNLFDEMMAAEIAPATAGVTADVELRWFSRPPYTVRLRIPRNVAVQNAEARGAVDLLLADVAQARAAGVQVLVDFPQPRWRDEQSTDARFAVRAGLALCDAVAVEESQPRLAAAASFPDTQPSGEGLLLFAAVLDATRFDSSVLQ
nr:hypothetical protein [uncultured Rhodopila sp.]